MQVTLARCVRSWIQNPGRQFRMKIDQRLVVEFVLVHTMLELIVCRIGGNVLLSLKSSRNKNTI